MTIEFSSKQPFEAYHVSFDFTNVLGAAIISTMTVIAVDELDSSDVSAVLLDLAKQTNTNTVVYPWVRAGTSGHRYLITCQIVADDASQYELDAILPVEEIPNTGTSSGGGCVTPPIIEPITLAELKLHLRIDSGSIADRLDETQGIAPGSHAIANDYITHVGTAVEVFGYSAVVYVQAGINGATGTVDVKIQESDDTITWTDWTGGAFTQITEANDNTTYEKAYTGTKRYIRTVAKVLLAACEFGTTIVRLAPTAAEDDLLNAIITGAREHIEDLTRRALLTQTWDYSLQAWPDENFIKLPYGNLQSVVSVKWKDADGVETTLTPVTDYLVETNAEQCGKVILPYGGSWPSGALYPSNPITIRFTCGWTTAALVPYKIKTAIKMLCAKLYEQRGEDGPANLMENKLIDQLLASSRLWDHCE